MAEIKYAATGKRKSSIAKVTLLPGTGRITVNEKSVEQYFPRETLQMMVRQPFELCGLTGKYDISASVMGGGMSGQAGALRHGISKVLTSMDSELRLKLKKEGFLTRDPRIKERKKYGQKAARRRFQFSKR